MPPAPAPLRMLSAARAAFWSLSLSSWSALPLSATASLARSISASISPPHCSISPVIFSMLWRASCTCCDKSKRSAESLDSPPSSATAPTKASSPADCAAACDPDGECAEFFGFSSPFSGMGGMGGGAERGMRGSRFGMFGDDIFGSFPQFPGEASMQVPQRSQKAAPIENRLPCNLADLYKGTTKKMKISREILDAGGRSMVVEEILTIDIKPGWKKGTKITFPEKGNEAPHVIPADIVFVIDEKPHDQFTREGNDLVMTQKISLAEALTECTVHITTLDGRNLTIPINSVVYPGYEEIVPREGMPIPKDPSKKGNLRIKFNIKFPSRLTTEQKAEIKRLLGS